MAPRSVFGLSLKLLAGLISMNCLPVDAQQLPKDMMTDRGALLTIPGPWKDYAELAASISRTSQGRAAVQANTLIDREVDKVRIELLESSPSFMNAIVMGAGGTIEEPQLLALRKHTHSAWLRIDGGPNELSGYLRHVGELLRAAGGLAVSLPEAGFSHGWARWERVLTDDPPFAAYNALVVHVGDKTSVCSFGAKQLNLPDSCAPSAHGGQKGTDLLQAFNIYNWTSSPKLSNGHTFSLTPEGARFRLNRGDDRRYSIGDIFHNPYGVWQMAPVRR